MCGVLQCFQMSVVQAEQCCILRVLHAAVARMACRDPPGPQWAADPFRAFPPSASLRAATYSWLRGFFLQANLMKHKNNLSITKWRIHCELCAAADICTKLQTAAGCMSPCMHYLIFPQIDFNIREYAGLIMTEPKPSSVCKVHKCTMFDHEKNDHFKYNICRSMGAYRDQSLVSKCWNCFKMLCVVFNSPRIQMASEQKGFLQTNLRFLGSLLDLWSFTIDYLM